MKLANNFIVENGFENLCFFNRIGVCVSFQQCFELKLTTHFTRRCLYFFFR